ncbi:MAG: ChbG/HpnK family deacetylase [Chthoniobacterales bacterium]|nr:ChbG/HpnK family deacetylase [Chthoniobacterales bacterium]
MKLKASSRHLIVNADDFGLSSGVNRGIAEARERGILTSASLMVRAAGAREAAEYAWQHSAFSVGLHFDLGEWRFAGGEWVQHYEIVDSNNADAVRVELDRQLAAFMKLLDRPPTHLDSHQHIHLAEPARSIVIAAANELRVPVRNCTPQITYCGAFYGQTDEGEPQPQGISVDQLIRMIERLPFGWTEVGTHPGYSAALDSVYASEREVELRVLCSPAVQAAVAKTGVQLCSYHDLRL